MCRANPGYRINFHSGDNWSPPWDRLGEASPANDYLEHFPYLSNLWFGELYDYDMPPDYWFVETSGIPFGLTGEMLNYENGGNPYRAMLYGMSGRQHPSCTAMWAFWDQFGIADAQLLGYWDARCPVRTGRDDVLATVYRKPGTALISLASWSSAPAQVSLQIDWRALGLDPKTARLTAPPIMHFQGPATFRPDEPIPVEPGKGWLIVVDRGTP
jgi:hypothetical protein